jgi:transposase
MKTRLDFAPRQRASPQRFVCKAILANHNITVLEHPPYSPDLAPCYFFFFPKIKSVLKGTHFLSVEDVKGKTSEVLNTLSESYLQNCFES